MHCGALLPPRPLDDPHAPHLLAVDHVHVGALALAALFVAFSVVKLRKVKRNRTAAEKLYRYAAIWTPLYATAWCFSLASEYEDLRDAGFILAGLGLLGLIGVTTLREVYAVVEHPVGYRR